VNFKKDFNYYGFYRIFFASFCLFSWAWDMQYVSETYRNYAWLFSLGILWIIPFGFGWNRRIFAGIGAIYLLLLGIFANDIRSPEMPFIFFQLCLWTLLPTGELSWSKRADKGWKVDPESLTVYAWFIGLAHFVAGVSKIFSADKSWVTGEGFKVLLETSPWIRDGAAQLLLQLPSEVLMFSTYMALILEVIGGLLMLFAKTRSNAVVFLILLHIVSLALFQLPQVSLGVIVCLLYFKAFDSKII
jgi:hypothetical protein